MENNAAVRGLCKNFGDFCLDEVTFGIPAGCVVGLIGENGAGKSTVIKCILGLVRPDKGETEVFGKDAAFLSKKEREEVGAVLGESCLPENLTLKEVSGVMARIFSSWDEEGFFALARRFSLPEKKKVREFSRGMRQKAALAVALSHGARLLLLDEPTSGLDPVARDEILDILYDFMRGGEYSALISSHILSDLEKLCDYIVFLHEGKVVFFEEKDALSEKYALFRGSAEEFSALGPCVAAYMRGEFGVSALVYRQAAPAGTRLEKAGIEDIMLYYSRGERL